MLKVQRYKGTKYVLINCCVQLIENHGAYYHRKISSVLSKHFDHEGQQMRKLNDMYDNILLGRKVSTKLHFKQGWNCKRCRNKAGMKICEKSTLLWNDSGKRKEKTTLHLMQQVQASLLVFPFCHYFIVGQSSCIFHPCLASVLLTGPCLLEVKFCRNFFP